jgi:hypothetical protein
MLSALIILSLIGLMIASLVVFLHFIRWFFGLFKSRPKNGYIHDHSNFIRNKSEYEDYLKWCDENNQVPMDKRFKDHEDDVLGEVIGRR